MLQREEAPLEDIEYVIRPRTDCRTQKITRAILDELRNRGPLLIDTLYDEKKMHKLVIEHMYQLSIDEAEYDPKTQKEIEKCLEMRGYDQQAAGPVTVKHDTQMKRERERFCGKKQGVHSAGGQDQGVHGINVRPKRNQGRRQPWNQVVARREPTIRL